MKKYRYSLILLGLLVSVLFIGFFSSVARASGDIDYTFQNDIFYEDSQPLINKTFNVRNATELTEIYNATYSFDNETGLIGDDIPFIDTDDSAVDCITSIIDNWNGHNEVLQLFDDNNAGRIDVYSNFGDKQLDSTIELWFGVSTFVGNNYFNLIFYEDSDIILQAKLENGNFQYYDGGWNIINSDGVINTWYQFKFIFDDTADTFDWYINGILEGNDNPYLFSTTDGFNKIRIVTNLGDNNFKGYIDAIGYSWDDNYDIGDNMIPFLNVSSTIRVVDRYEFALSDIDTWYDALDEDPSGFNTYVVGTGNSHIVKVISENRRVFSQCQNTGSQAGIKKEDFNLHGEFVNITIGIRYTERVDVAGFGVIRVYAFDNTEILQLRLDDADNLEYFDGVGYNLLYAGDIGAYEDHEFYCFINYELDLVFLSHYIDGVFNKESIFPLIVSGKEGLKAVDVGTFTFSAGTDTFIQFVEYIGVYINGTSQADEFGYIAFDLEQLEGFDGDWGVREYNFFRIRALGFFTIGVSAGNGYFEDYFYATLINERQYTDIETFFNLYDVEQETSYSQPFIIIYLEQNNSFENLTLINIEGVKLLEGSNKYPLIFSHGNVDIDDNYFYVVGDTLYFSLDTNQNNLEFIQASFDIANLITENYSVRFSSNVFGASSCNLRMNYTDDTSSILEFPSHATITSLILPQEKEVGEVIVLITDNDLISQGSTTGYIRDISFIYFRDIATAITTFSLLTVLVPLMVLIIPPIAMRVKFGNSAVVPMFILMSIVAFATELIPIWLFFLMIVSSGVFLIGKNKIGGEF